MEIRSGAAAATILPEQGAAFAALSFAGRDLLRPVPAGADPNRGFHGAFLMAPWTNRLDGGRIVVAGTEHRMPLNRPEEGTAIHGFLRDAAWDVAERGDDHLVLTCGFDRAPFTGRARLAARIAPDHLALDVALTNLGRVPTPMGFGWHPYFPRPEGTRLRAATRIGFGRDARNLPTDPRPDPGFAGDAAELHHRDGHFSGWDGLAEIAWPDGGSLALRATGAWAANVHVYVPPHREALAIEPVSHAPDAANRPDAAAHGAMHVLDAGATLAGALTLHWR